MIKDFIPTGGPGMRPRIPIWDDLADGIQELTGLRMRFKGGPAWQNDQDFLWLLNRGVGSVKDLQSTRYLRRAVAHFTLMDCKNRRKGVDWSSKEQYNSKDANNNTKAVLENSQWRIFQWDDTSLRSIFRGYLDV